MFKIKALPFALVAVSVSLLSAIAPANFASAATTTTKCTPPPGVVISATGGTATFTVGTCTPPKIVPPPPVSPPKVSPTTPTQSPTASPTPTPTPIASSCSTTTTAIGVVGSKVSSGLVHKTTTTCVPAPPVTTNSIMTIPNGYGPAYWTGNPLTFYNAPKIYHAPAGLTNGNAPIETAVTQCTTLPPTSANNGLVQLSPYGINYTDMISNNVATTTYADGTFYTNTTTTFRKTFYGTCVYPYVNVLTCQTDLTSVEYTGATGTNTDAQVVIPTGVAPAVATAGSTTTDPGVWSNVSVPGLVNIPAVGKATAIQLGDQGSTWRYTPKTPIETQIGALINSNSQIPASKFVSAGGSTIVPKECGGNLFQSFTVPLALVTNGEYKLTATGHSVSCYVIERNFGSNTFSGCSRTRIPEIQNQVVSKYCGTVVAGSAGVDYSASCSPNPKPTPSPSPSSTVTPLPANTNIVTDPQYSCSILGYPTVTSPLGSTVDSSKTIQVLSQAATASNSSPWTLTWAKPTFSSYGNMEPLSIRNQSTALILADGSQPYNWNQAATAPTQPTVGTPDLSPLSDPNPSTLPGWGVDSTLVFYKKAAPNSTFTVSQQARFTALFPFPMVTTDANGNQIVTQSWISRTATCDAAKKVKFQVSGVKALP